MMNTYPVYICELNGNPIALAYDRGVIDAFVSGWYSADRNSEENFNKPYPADWSPTITVRVEMRVERRIKGHIYDV